MANKTYVLSDLHGHYLILQAMLKKIKFDETDTLYILGDCNDRGPRSAEIYEYIRRFGNIILLKGNHELMMRDMLKKGDWKCPDGRLWAQNGGRKTMDSFILFCEAQAQSIDDMDKLLSHYCADMISYVDACPKYVELHVEGKDYILVHAGFNPEKPLIEQSEEECVWMRDWFYMSPGMENKFIIFGHTPTPHLHGKPCYDPWIDPVYKDKMGIDGGLGSYEDGQLNCICLNDQTLTVLRKKDVEGEVL